MLDLGSGVSSEERVFASEAQVGTSQRGLASGPTFFHDLQLVCGFHHRSPGFGRIPLVTQCVFCVVRLLSPSTRELDPIQSPGLPPRGSAHHER